MLIAGCPSVTQAKLWRAYKNEHDFQLFLHHRGVVLADNFTRILFRHNYFSIADGMSPWLLVRTALSCVLSSRKVACLLLAVAAYAQL